MLTKGLVNDIPAESFARLPKADGTTVTINHPAFALGHLTLYPSKMLAAFGLDPTPLDPPSGYEELFAPGVECQDDPEGSIYPSKDETLAAFFDRHEKCVETIKGLRDEDFERPLEVERYREAFGTAGGLSSFMLGAHAGFHLGQISAWRRAMGMGSAF